MTHSLWHLSFALKANISRLFPSPNVSLFLRRFCKKTFLVRRFFLSADSVSKILSSADSYAKFCRLHISFFVSKCLCRRHLNDAHAGIVRFAPAYFLTEKFSPSAGAHFRFYHDSIRFAGPSCRMYVRA